ncbi:MAG: alpha/beta hydrolase-fold protein [Pirellulales bacterium]
MPSGHWTTIDLSGHPADVFEPDRPDPRGFVILYLHGVHLTRLVENPVFTDLFAQLGLRVFSPMTGPSWWVDRICPAFDPGRTAERHVLDHALPWIAERWNTRAPLAALLGTSMGGQGALRLAFRHPNIFPVAAAIAPAVDFYRRIVDRDPVLSQMYPDAEAARQDSATLHVHALNWPRHTWFSCDPADDRWHDSADKLHMKLFSLGIPHEHDLETSAGGHSFDYYNHMAPAALQFIVDRLERERLRVP